MQESAKAALTCLRSRWEELGLPRDFYKTKDVHVHFPEGAVLKDGPSAGIAITTAMLSALTGRPVRYSVAMTGEVTLRGRVLAIGGLKETAGRPAKRRTYGADSRENVKDLDEIDQTVRAGLHFIPVDTVDQVIAVAGAFRGEHAAPVAAYQRNPRRTISVKRRKRAWRSSYNKAEFIRSAVRPEAFIPGRTAPGDLPGDPTWANPPSSTACSTGRTSPGWAPPPARPPR